MNSEDAQLRARIEATVRSIRLFGLAFFVLSGAFALFIAFFALDPSVPFRMNGVQLHDTGDRVRMAAFSFLFPIASAVVLFCPRSILKKLVRHQFSEMEKMKERFGIK